MRAHLIGGPLHGETFEVGRTTQVIDLDLGNGTFASYRLNVGGDFSYDGVVLPTSNSTFARTGAVPVSFAIGNPSRP